MVRGTYVLLFKIDQETVIKVGSLGEIRLPPGRYAYVGKAIGIPLERRIRHHLKDVKKARRHVDYVTLLMKPTCILYTEEVTDESTLVSILKEAGRVPVVKGFGSSDDPESYSHLLYSLRPRIPSILKIYEDYKHDCHI